ncbi:CHRD domain-containing protein [Ruegeria sp.]|uniref:CHRD domain-containing protein n=1 Tax=Ruegeria sp. TaxID=1879320 RepID=UPI0023251E25|nr:CHRD domain-containing protein [Ruegeria sp.]MDA7965354.1 CHRD domain-containing protein [Ruegeria sp.]
MNPDDIRPIIEGDENGNQLIGTPEDDIIRGNGGGDQLIGMGGNDDLSGGAGDDNIIGGEGIDTARFDDVNAFVTISEDPDMPGRIIATREVMGENGETIIEEDELSGIENVIFSEAGGEINVEGIFEVVDAPLELQDVMDQAELAELAPEPPMGQIIDGDDNDNVLVGGDGDDVLNGLGGNDVLTGGLGDDVLDGGADIDTAAFNDIDVPVDVDLDAGIASRETGFSVQIVDADFTNFADPLDSLVDEALAENLYYNIHTADFPAGEIRGQLLVSENNLDFEGNGTLVLTAVLDAAQEPGPLSDSLATGTATVTVTVIDGVATYSSDLSVTGLAVSDLITPIPGAVSAIHLHNAPAGENGPVVRDSLVDAGGILASADEVAENPTGVLNIDFVTDAVTETDTLISIENVVGSDDADVLVGDENDNVLSGLGGDDVLTGGLGDDVLDGGADIDTAVFNDIDVPVNVDLDAGIAIRETGFSVQIVDADFTNFGDPLDSLVDEALAENLYYNIHTADFPAGEIRGQLLVSENNLDFEGNGTLVLTAVLDAAQEPGPLSDSLATGTATVTVTVIDGVATYSSDLSVTGLAVSDLITPIPGAVSAIHLHNAPAGENGPVVRDSLVDAGGILASADEVAENPTGVLNIDFVTDAVTETDTLISIENVVGSDDDDVLVGDANDNVLNGLDGNDVLSGLGGNDVLNGGEGDDILAGGGGVDVIDGGEGFDTNDFSNINLGAADPTIAGVRVTLAADGTGTAEYNGGGGNGPLIQETFTGIENITGSSNDDSIVATGAAPNTIEGGAGDDFIAGGGGTDILSGGDGIDTNSFQGINAEVIADLATGSASYAPNENVTVFENFDGFENLDGSALDDQLFGDNGANTLTGNDGNDLLVGRGGNDILEGGEGNDVLRGGGGNDITDGGEGIDTADFQDIGSAVTADLSDGTAVYAAPNGNQVADQLISIENLTGSDNDDILTGDTGDNLLAGGAGNDVINGGAGDDVIRGDAIGDGEAITVSITNTLDAGGTFLTPVWFGFHDGANFDLFNAGEAASLGLERLAEDGSVEGIAAEFNQQVGDNGIDATILGGAGAPGPIDPGETATFTLNVNADQVGQGFFTWATMVIPSNDAFLAAPDDVFADPIFDAEGNFIGPIVIERFGRDVLDAGTEVNNEEGAAFLNQTARDQGTAENGVVGLHPGFNGSEGNPNGGPVNILGGTTAAGTIVDPVEGDFTRNGGNEQLLRIEIDIAEGGNDELFGGAGDDTIDGGRGDDILDGGADNDTLIGGSGRDTFTFRRGTGFDIVADFSVSVEDGDFLDVSDFGITSIDDLQIEANGADTVIDLGNGDQITLEGVAPNELVAENFVFAPEQPEVNVAPTNGDDDLQGGVGNDEIDGGNGEDIILGGAGNDILDGGNGDDDLIGEIGDDNLIGSNGDDDLNGGIGSDTLAGGNGDDFLVGGEGADRLEGGRGDDILEGGEGADTLEGGRGNDILDGGEGNDLICAGTGDDIINGGEGNDRLEGNRGSDTFVFEANLGDDVITDFEAFADGDVLDLTSTDFDFDTFDDLSAAISQNGDDVVIDLGAEGSITLLGIQVADLNEDNVLV